MALSAACSSRYHGFLRRDDISLPSTAGNWFRLDLIFCLESGRSDVMIFLYVYALYVFEYVLSFVYAVDKEKMTV